MGTLEFRCALEPVRRYGDSVASYQAWCKKIDFKRKKLECLPALVTNVKAKIEKQVEQAALAELGEASGPSAQVPSLPGVKPFTIEYDKLVIAVGAYSQTFNTPGVCDFECLTIGADLTQPFSFLSVPYFRRSRSTLIFSRMSVMLA